MRWTACRALLAFAATLALARDVPAANFVPLGDLLGGDRSSTAYAISNDGNTVVGTSSSATDFQAFRWSALTGMLPLGDLPGGGDESAALGVSGDGVLAVGYGSAAGGAEAASWQLPLLPRGLGTLGGEPPHSVANDASADGAVIVGHGTTLAGLEAFVHAGGALTPLGDFPGGPTSSSATAVSDDGAVVVGRGARPGAENEAFRWEAGVMTGLGDLAGGRVDSRARGVSGDGSTIVGDSVSELGIEAFVWTEAEGMRPLGDLAGGAFESRAHGVSADGGVVVGHGTSAEGRRAVIWNQHGLIDLTGAADALGLLPAGWELEEAFGVSADGLAIVGRASNAAGRNEAFLLALDVQPMPEPGAALSLTAGALLLSLLRRRRSPRFAGWLALPGLAFATGAAAQPAVVEAGFAAHAITPVGPSPPGWDFVPEPTTGVWGEPFVDANGNGCFDFGEELHVDDPRNTLIDPLSALKWDGIWTNAGFGGRCAQGSLDDIWARAVVFSQGDQTVAMVSVDVVGWFQEEVDRIRTELADEHPDIELDALIVSATHAHEGPDTMGLWHGVTGLDGKFPLYMAFVRDRIVAAIADAHAARESAHVRFARGTESRGLRDSRPPVVFDTDVWTAQFVRESDGTTLGTLVNWSNHPEALGSGNPMISSDYAHGVRTRMEAVYGGTSIFFSGSVGGLMTPLSVTNVPGFPTDDRSHARAVALGEMVAEAAIAALDAAPLVTNTEVSVAHKEFVVPMENLSLFLLNTAGVFDKELALDFAGQIGVRTEMYAVHLGPAVFVTVPGELFPEIAGGGYGRPECPEAHTGRPLEPVIRDQFAGSRFPFLFGLGQDELGYIVPRYDFWAFGFPPPDETFPEPVPPPPPVLPDPDPRPPIYVGVLEREDPCGESHYEETVSIGSVLAPLVACTAAELAGHDPFADYATDPRFAACSPGNTTAPAGGITLPEPSGAAGLLLGAWLVTGLARRRL